jgi:hypothetical protein
MTYDQATKFVQAWDRAWPLVDASGWGALVQTLNMATDTILKEEAK